MTTIDRFRNAETAAAAIIEKFVADQSSRPDHVAVRTEELSKMKKDELVELILSLEKPKTDAKPKVEDIARALLVDEACAILPYEAIAQLVHRAIPESNTSSKSIASYFSKKGKEWGALKRVKLQINPLAMLAEAR